MSNELVVTDSSAGNPYAIMPVLDIQAAAARRQAVVEFTARMLKPGTDFGVIPGTGDKPTLLKPGAEKLASLFGLTPDFDPIETIMDWTGDTHGGEPFFFIRYRCTLRRGSMAVGQGVGSCNSWEKKYRWRQGERRCPECGQAAIIKGKQEYGGGWLCFKKKGGCGYKFPDGDGRIESQEVGQVKNPDPADVVNTIDKMAQKRALVAAVLIAVNASEMYTQDVEDYSDIIDGEWSAAPQAPARPAAAKPTPPPAQPARATGNGQQQAAATPLDTFLAQAEQRPSVQAVEFANGRLRAWVEYVTDKQFDQAHADYLNEVLDRYCSAVADNDNTHTKAAAEKARDDYRQGLAALKDDGGQQDDLFGGGDDSTARATLATAQGQLD